MKRSTVNALALRTKVIDATLAAQAANAGRAVTSLDVLAALYGARPADPAESRGAQAAMSRMCSTIAAYGADELGRRLVFAARTGRGYTWTVVNG